MSASLILLKGVWLNRLKATLELVYMYFHINFEVADFHGNKSELDFNLDIQAVCMSRLKLVFFREQPVVLDFP